MIYKHITLKVLIDLLKGQIKQLELLIIINNNTEWEVEDIFDVRTL